MRFLVTILLTCTALCSAAQDDSTVYRHGLPVSDDDTVQNFPERDYSPRENVVVVPHSKLPKDLKDELNENAEFKGWQDMPVLFDHNTGRYIVRIKNDTTVTTIGVNKNGKPVTYGVGTQEE